MLASNSGPDIASRAALRSLMQRLPGMSTVEGGGLIEPVVSSDPPSLRSAQIVEGTALRAIRIPNLSAETGSQFGAFLDGAQKFRSSDTTRECRLYSERSRRPCELGSIGA